MGIMRRLLARIGPSVGQQLTLATTLPVFVVLAVAGALLLNETQSRYERAARQRAFTHLVPLAVPCARALSVHALDRLDSYLAEAVNVRTEGVQLLDAQVFDTHGDLIASVTATSKAEGRVSASTRELTSWRKNALTSANGTWLTQHDPEQGHQLHISVPTISGLRWGTLFATFDISGLQNEAALAERWMIGIFALVVLTLIFTLRLALSQLVLSPVSELARSTGALRDGHLDERAWVPGRDEFSSLANNFNAMADELRSYTLGLEQKVQSRTEEVEKQKRELEAVNSRLADAVDKLEQLANSDGLTGVANRRSFDEALKREWQRGARSPQPFCVVMIDVDHFKHYNDTNGHQAGDVALKNIAKILGNSVRKTDLLARYGGEEFVVLLLDTEKDAGVQVAELLRAAIEGASFDFGERQPLGRVTASLGVSSWPEDAEAPERVLECADKALYEAKAQGRNRVIAFNVDLVIEEVL